MSVDGQVEEPDETAMPNNKSTKESDFDSFNFEQAIAEMLLELRENFKTSTAATCFVSEKIKYILDIDRQIHTKLLIKSLNIEDAAPPSDIVFSYETNAIILSQSPFSKARSKFTGEKSLSEYVKRCDSFVEPIELRLGFNAEMQKADTIQYIPLYKTLNVLLSYEDTLSAVLKSQEVTEHDKVLRTYHDGGAFKSNSLLNSEKKTLEIVLYHDDFGIVNPLGNKTVKYKTSGFYFVLGNLSPQYRSRQKDIHLAIMCSSKLISKYGYQEILRPLLDDFRKLENEGIYIKFDNFVHQFYGNLTMVVADNLAAHALGCFFCNFSTVQENLKANLPSSSFSLRTSEGYDKNVLNINADKTLSSVYGIKGNSCLNCLQYYHVINGLPPDIAHDTFKGFATDFLQNLLSYFIQLKVLTPEIVNVAISSFNYSPIDEHNKSQVLKIISNATFKNKQTACEMWNLIRLFPLLFGQHIPTGNEVWNLCISFCQVVERLCAVTFTRGDLAILQFLIDNFLERYVSLFPDVNLKPKAHFLRHYPEMIGRFGPLIKRLRFEAKHGYFKSLFNINNNRKNVFQSMAKRQQFMMFLHYAQDNLLGHKKPHCFGSKEVSVELFKGPIQAVIRESICLHGTDLIAKGYAVELNGQTCRKWQFILK